jgi:hypothetical protein
VNQFGGGIRRDSARQSEARPGGVGADAQTVKVCYSCRKLSDKRTPFGNYYMTTGSPGPNRLALLPRQGGRAVQTV